MRAIFERFGIWLTGQLGFEVFKKTNRFVFLGIIITMYVSLYVAFMATIVGIASFSPHQPGGNVAAGLALLPGNIMQCMSAIGATHVVSHVFMMKAKILRMSTKAA